MADSKNEFGQPIGMPVPDWQGRSAPPRTSLQGAHVRLEPLNTTKHAARLFDTYAASPDASNWTYLPYGPFASAGEYTAWVESMAAGDDPLAFAIVGPTNGQPLGVASYLRINPAHGSIEVGHLSYSPALQRTAAATEAMYLMMRRAFEELGYRRYEWKCDSRNAPSRRAAERLGFRYEGTFRNALVMKGRNRDTAWFSIIDKEWPAIRSALESWLDSSNFDEAGRQRRRLQTWMPGSKPAFDEAP
jgi:RimJ/RimL family protein N-acetyltransferase